MRKIICFTLLMFLTSCASSSPLDFFRGVFGYIPPPEETSIGEELQLEYERCIKIGGEKNCAQAAYDIVRTVKGLEPRSVPKGIVIILEGDGGHGAIDEELEKDQKEEEQP